MQVYIIDDGERTGVPVDLTECFPEAAEYADAAAELAKSGVYSIGGGAAPAVKLIATRKIVTRPVSSIGPRPSTMMSRTTRAACAAKATAPPVAAMRPLSPAAPRIAGARDGRSVGLGPRDPARRGDAVRSAAGVQSNAEGCLMDAHPGPWADYFPALIVTFVGVFFVACCWAAGS